MRYSIIFILSICVIATFFIKEGIDFNSDMELVVQDMKNEAVDQQTKIRRILQGGETKTKVSFNYDPDALTATWYDYGLIDEDNGLDVGIPWYSKLNATAASRDYPKETCLLVHRVGTNKYVTVRINDYGPTLYTGHSLDLSSYAFEKLADLELGVIEITINEVGCGK